MTTNLCAFLRRAACAAMVAVTLAALPFTAAAQADGYPARPVRLIVPYGAGGSLDVMARLLANEMAKGLGQSVVVENVAGAGGTLGFKRVLSAPADGYTLLVGITSEVALAPTTNPSARYKATDLEAIAKLGTSGIVLIGRQDLAADSLQALLDLARAQPGKLRYATSGTGSLQHLAMEMAKLAAGVDIPFIPYKSASQITTDLVGGHIDLAIVGLPGVLPLIREGKVKAYGVVSRRRDIGNKAIPAFAETPALQSIDFHLWTGVFAPRGTPLGVVQKLHGAIAAALKQPEIARRYAELGVELAAPMSSSQFAQYVASQERDLRAAVEQSGIKVEQP